MEFLIKTERAVLWQAMQECRRQRLLRAGMWNSARATPVPDTPWRYALKSAAHTVSMAGALLMAALLAGWDFPGDDELLTRWVILCLLLEAAWKGVGVVLTLLAFLMSPWQERTFAEDDASAREARRAG